MNSIVSQSEYPTSSRSPQDQRDLDLRARRTKEANRFAKYREDQSEEDRTSRKEKDRERDAKKRAEETEEFKTLRLERNKEKKKDIQQIEFKIKLMMHEIDLQIF